MTNAFLQSVLAKKASSKTQNGFTLIELMVVVAIVGILSAVGLPELTKAQDRAKDQTAVATLTNAAKECSLSLITNGDASEFADTDGAPTNPNFASVVGTCAENEELGLASEGNFDGVKVELTGAIPGTVEEATTAELTTIAG